jgi:hypothetical protein
MVNFKNSVSDDPNPTFLLYTVAFTRYSNNGKTMLRVNQWLPKAMDGGKE